MLSKKRRTHPNMETSSEKPKRRRPRIKLETVPPVHSLSDLIKLGSSLKFYKNFDIVMLWRINSYLQELDQMIGMESLKETIFYQIVYYLQGMHAKSKNEDYLHTVIYGPPGCGKCLGKNTPVMLYNGTTKMVQDITTEDILLGDDSKPRNILSICTGREKMYKIAQSYGDDYTVNESHILSLKLSKSPTIEDKIDHFIIKWFDQYGYNMKKFSYENQDKNTVRTNCDNYIKFLPQKGTVIDIPVREYILRAKLWKSAFKGYKVGIDFPRQHVEIDPYVVGCHIVKIPDEYKYNTEEIRLQLLAGILDSDGNTRNNCYEIRKKIFGYDVIWLARSLGLKAYINGKHHIIISGNIGKIPCKKHIEPENKDVDPLMYEIKVKELGEDTYYGFEIDGNRRFLLGDFTVTHNTTVAKIIGKIYQEMNILSQNGTFKIAYRDDFVAGYLGQTAAKTKKLLQSCIGGVLFIDEVYALAPRSNDKDSFAKEAIDTLTGFLSEHKNNFCCIIAGYEEEINNCFFSMNRGLERRFPWIHRISEYSSKDLYQIFMKMVRDIEWEISFDEKFLISIFEKHKNRFKNVGGDIETFLTKCKIFHSQRVFSLSKEHKFIISKEDVKSAIDFLEKNNNNPKEDRPPEHMYV